MLGFIKMLPIMLVVGLMAFGAHKFIVNEKDKRLDQLQVQVDMLNQQNVALQTAAQTNEQTIRSMETQMREQAVQVGALTEKNGQLQAEKDQYLKIFRDHDFTKLARAKPGLIQPRVNRGTADVFRQIEQDSREIQNADAQTDN
jgi:hypothetical protein